MQTENVVKEFYMDRTGIFVIELKPAHKCIGCIDLRLCIDMKEQVYRK